MSLFQKVTHLLCLLIVTAALLAPAGATAEDLYQLAWRGLVYSTNTSGRITARTFTEQLLIKKVAQDNGLDPATLRFVYRADKRDLVVVRASDGAFIANVLEMEFLFTDVSNASNSYVVRQAMVFAEDQDPPLGSAFGIEQTRRGSAGQRIAFGFSGNFQYSKAGKVYKGSFYTIRKIRQIAS